MKDELENETPEPQAPPAMSADPGPTAAVSGNAVSPDPTPEQAAADLEELELPSMFWGSLFKYFGPGIILMMTGIGTSHRQTARHRAMANRNQRARSCIVKPPFLPSSLEEVYYLSPFARTQARKELLPHGLIKVAQFLLNVL